MKPLHFLAAILLFIFLFSCQNNANENKTITALTDSTVITGLTDDSVKLIKTAAINYKVKMWNKPQELFLHLPKS